MKQRTRVLVVALSTPILAFALVGGFLGRASASQSSIYKPLGVFEEVVSLMNEGYVEKVDVNNVMTGAMRGLVDSLDADSAFLTPADFKLSQAPLPSGGVGLQLTRNYYLRVIGARDGSPALRAGLTTADHIRAIDGKPTRDLSVLEGTRLLRGEPGTKVSLTVLRGNINEPHIVELVREKESVPDVMGRMATPTVGYVRVAAFGPLTAEQMKARVQELTKAGAESLIVDLERTAEGPIDAGIAAARAFVPSGTLAIREGRSEARETTSATAGDGAIRLPVLVLTTNGTSGAAEVFAAALRDNKRAQLVGERTLGRAAAQKMVKLPDGSGLWISWARYLTPSGTAIHLKGLAPDIEAAEADVEFGAPAPASDPILEKALQQATLKKAA